MSKPPAGYPGLIGDLTQDPIGESLRDRLNFGGLGTSVDEVTIKKHGCKVPKQIKLLVKGKDHVELISEQSKDSTKDAKPSQKPSGVKPPTSVKSKVNETANEKAVKPEEEKK